MLFHGPLAVVGLMALAAFGACRNGKQETGHTTQTVSGGPKRPQQKGNPPLPRQIVSFHSQGQVIRVSAEVAKTPEERRLGLMYRKQLGENDAMLFIFDKEEPQSFWMKNTYVSLDMVFINDAKEIVNIVARTEPLTETSRPSTGPARYVVEVNAGFCERHGIKAGAKVEF